MIPIEQIKNELKTQIEAMNGDLSPSVMIEFTTEKLTSARAKQELQRAMWVLSRDLDLSAKATVGLMSSVASKSWYKLDLGQLSLDEKRRMMAKIAGGYQNPATCACPTCAAKRAQQIQTQRQLAA